MSAAETNLIPVRRTGWSAAELMATTFPPPRWAVPGVVAEGVNLLAGAPKLGKSWLSLNLAVSVATGGKALGSIDVDAGDVLYLALEDTGRRLQDRLSKVLAGDLPPDRLRFETECETLGAGGAERIDRWCQRHPGARLVVIDTLAKVKPITTDRSSVYAADYHAVGLIKAVADAHGVPVVVVHHTRKMAADDFLDTVSGSQGIAGAADAVLVLARSRGAAGAVLKITGRDVEEAEHALDFEPRSGTWRMLAGPASDYAMGDTRRSILHLLRDDQPRTPKAIALELALSEATVRQTCRRMFDDDQIDTDGNGHYFALLSPVTAVTPVTQDDRPVTPVTAVTAPPERASL